MTPVLLDLSFIVFLLTAGLVAGWLLSNIAYNSKLRRIRIETWREAAKKYHGLITRAYANQPPAKIKLP